MPSTLLQTGSPLPTSQRPEKAPSHSTSAVGATALARRAARSASLPSTDGPTSPCPQPALPHHATCRCPGNLGSSVLDTQASRTVCGEGLRVRQVTLDKLSTPASPAPDHKQNRASPRPRTLPRALPPTGMPTSSAACWLHGDTLNTLSPQDPAPCSSLSEGGSSARSRPRPHQLTRLPGADADESLSRIQLHGGHGHRPRPYD